MESIKDKLYIWSKMQIYSDKKKFLHLKQMLISEENRIVEYNEKTTIKEFFRWE